MKARTLIFLSFLVLLITPAFSYFQANIYRVKRVVDGDTLPLVHRETIRLGERMDKRRGVHPQKLANTSEGK